VPPGAKVRCLKCGKVFRTASSEGGPDEDRVASWGVEAGLFSDWLDAEHSSTSATTGEEGANSYGGVTNQRFTPGLDTVAPPSARSKDRLIGGKSVRFEGSRKSTAVVIGFVLLVGGYLGFWWFHGWIAQLDKTGEILGKQRTARAERTDPGSAKKPGTKAGRGQGKGAQVSAKPQNPTPPLESTVAVSPARATAPNPVRLDEMEVSVVEARVAEERLIIRLRITNRSRGQVMYHCWSHPDNQMILRDLSPNLMRHALLEPSAQAVIPLKPGSTIHDVLVFRPTPWAFGLELDLPVWGSPKQFQFLIETGFIQRS
jgi:hypothetical protein